MRGVIAKLVEWMIRALELGAALLRSVAKALENEPAPGAESVKRLVVHKISGDGQTVLARRVAGEPLFVRLVDEQGQPVGGVGLLCEALGSDGIPFVDPPASFRSDANGVASVKLLAGGRAGAAGVRITPLSEYDVVPVEFTLTVVGPKLEAAGTGILPAAGADGVAPSPPAAILDEFPGNGVGPLRVRATYVEPATGQILPLIHSRVGVTVLDKLGQVPDDLHDALEMWPETGVTDADGLCSFGVLFRDDISFETADTDVVGIPGAEGALQTVHKRSFVVELALIDYVTEQTDRVGQPFEGPPVQQFGISVTEATGLTTLEPFVSGGKPVAGQGQVIGPGMEGLHDLVTEISLSPSASFDFVVGMSVMGGAGDLTLIEPAQASATYDVNGHAYRVQSPVLTKPADVPLVVQIRARFKKSDHFEPSIIRPYFVMTGIGGGGEVVPIPDAFLLPGPDLRVGVQSNGEFVPLTSITPSRAWDTPVPYRIEARLPLNTELSSFKVKVRSMTSDTEADTVHPKQPREVQLDAQVEATTEKLKQAFTNHFVWVADPAPGALEELPQNTTTVYGLVKGSFSVSAGGAATGKVSPSSITKLALISSQLMDEQAVLGKMGLKCNIVAVSKSDVPYVVGNDANQVPARTDVEFRPWPQFACTKQVLEAACVPASIAFKSDTAGVVASCAKKETEINGQVYVTAFPTFPESPALGVAKITAEWNTKDKKKQSDSVLYAVADPRAVVTLHEEEAQGKLQGSFVGIADVILNRWIAANKPDSLDGILVPGQFHGIAGWTEAAIAAFKMKQGGPNSFKYRRACVAAGALRSEMSKRDVIVDDLTLGAQSYFHPLCGYEDDNRDGVLDEKEKEKVIGQGETLLQRLAANFGANLEDYDDFAVVPPVFKKTGSNMQRYRGFPDDNLKPKQALIVNRGHVTRDVTGTNIDTVDDNLQWPSDHRTVIRGPVFVIKRPAATEAAVKEHVKEE